MALDGTAFAGYANRFAAYLAGETPDSLTPVAGGDAVPFVHDGRGEKAEATESGLVLTKSLQVFVQGTAPSVGDKYTYDGETWQVAMVDEHRCAGADWPHYVELVGHARQVKAQVLP